MGEWGLAEGGGERWRSQHAQARGGASTAQHSRGERHSACKGFAQGASASCCPAAAEVCRSHSLPEHEGAPGVRVHSPAVEQQGRPSRWAVLRAPAPLPLACPTPPAHVPHGTPEPSPRLRAACATAARQAVPNTSCSPWAHLLGWSHHRAHTPVQLLIRGADQDEEHPPCQRAQLWVPCTGGVGGGRACGGGREQCTHASEPVCGS